MENIVLIGGGLHANYCLDIIEKEGKYKVIGIIDSLKEVGTELFGYNVIGRQEELPTLMKEHSFQGGIITIGENWSRKKVFNETLNLVPKFKFYNAVHPSAIIGSNVKIGQGVVIMAGCIVNPDCKVGDFCFMATGAQLEHNSVMEDFSSISAGSVTGGMVHIGRFSAITLGVTIMDRIKIGENTVVGAGSLVTKDVPDNVLAYGNPAKIIRTRLAGEPVFKSR